MVSLDQAQKGVLCIASTHGLNDIFDESMALLDDEDAEYPFTLTTTKLPFLVE